MGPFGVTVRQLDEVALNLQISQIGQTSQLAGGGASIFRVGILNAMSDKTVSVNTTGYTNIESMESVDADAATAITPMANRSN